MNGQEKPRTVAGFGEEKSGLEAAAEIIRKITEQLRVHRLAGGNIRTDRIQHGSLHPAFLRQLIDDFCRELWLAEETHDFVMHQLFVQLADTFRTGFMFGIHAHGADGVQFVILFKVLVFGGIIGVNLAEFVGNGGKQ